MARTRDNSYTAFTINTSEVRYKAGEGDDAPLIQDATRTLANLNKILGGLERVIRSTTGEKEFAINRNRIQVDSASGVGSVQFFVKKEFEDRIKNAIKYYESNSPLINESLASLSSTMRIENAIKHTFERDDILGRKAISKFIVEADKAGGRAEVLPSTEAGKDKVRATLFTTEEEMKGKSEEKLFNETFPEAKAYSAVEKSKRDIKSQEELKKEQDKIAKSLHTEPSVLDDNVNKMMAEADEEEYERLKKEKKLKEAHEEYLRNLEKYYHTEPDKLETNVTNLMEKAKEEEAKKIDEDKKIKEAHEAYMLGLFKDTHTDPDVLEIEVNKKMAKAEEEERKRIEHDKKEQDRIEENKRNVLRDVYYTDPDALEVEVNKKMYQAEKEEQERLEKEDKLTKATIARALYIVGSTLVLIADITRRILTATLTRASEEKKSALEAKNIGISRESLRQANASDRALGIDEGTTAKAMQSIQSATGTLAGLDTAKVEELSRVLGEGTVNAINMALGKNDPENALGLILNEYFKRGVAGVNSFGMQVGQYQAQRELASALEKAGFNDIATILRNMFYMNDTGIYKGMVEGKNPYENYKNLYNPAEGGLSPADRQKLSELGQVVDRVNTNFSTLSENIKNHLLLSLEGFIDMLDKLNIGKDAGDIAKTNQQSVGAFESVIADTAIKSKEGEGTFSDILAKAGFGLEGSGFSSITEFKRELRSKSPKLNEKQQDYYNRLLKYLKTDEGLKVLSYLGDAELNEAKNKQAVEELTKGRKKGSVKFNGANYTSSNMVTTAEDIIDMPNDYVQDFAFARILTDMQKTGESMFTLDEIYEEFKSEFYPNGVKKGDVIWNKKIQKNINDENKKRAKENEPSLTEAEELDLARKHADERNPYGAFSSDFSKARQQVIENLKLKKARSLSNNIADAMIIGEAKRSEEYLNLASIMAKNMATVKSVEVISYSAKDKNAVVKVMFVDNKGNEVAKDITFRTDVPRDTTNYEVTVDETGKKVSTAYENSSSE